MGSKIRNKFVEHMEFTGLSKQTQRSYITGVKGVAKHYKRSPELITDDQVRAYFRHLVMERKLARASCYAYLSGIIYFYRHICSRAGRPRIKEFAEIFTNLLFEKQVLVWFIKTSCQ